MNPHIFREYDIRGIAETDLTDEVAGDVGRAFGTLVRRAGGRRVVLGHDVRTSSPRLHARVTEGLTACGLEVLDLGFLVTPGVYYAAVRLEADGALQVTGSHNPAEYNGFKMTLKEGVVYGERIQEMRRLIEARDFETGEGSVRLVPVLDEYLAAITSRVRLSGRPRIVLDAGNGTAGPAAVRLFEELGCEVDPLYCEPDGTFPNHLADPTVPAFMEDLIRRVCGTGADLGIGLDGDGDRIGLVDGQGRMVFGDQLLALLARDVIERVGPSLIIFDVKCSQGLIEDIEAHGGIPHMWKTGHSLIKTEMKRTGAPIAGEMSGHMFFTEGWFGFDDALYAGARLLGILDRWKRPLAELVDSIPSYVSTPELRVGCADEEKFRVVTEVTRRFKEREDVEVVDIDGARVLFGDGWGLLRASNTQPVLVLRFEGQDQAALDRVRGAFREVLQDYPAVALDELDAGGAGH
jgi:phosphomannomutase/phosphoglucomutase